MSMKKSSETLGRGYRTPECEVVGLSCDGAVIMSSPGAKINSWEWDSDEEDIEFN